MKFQIGERVCLNVMAMDGLDHPATVVGFLDDPDNPRHGQPIIVHDDRTGEQQVTHPSMLWNLADAQAAYDRHRAGVES